MNAMLDGCSALVTGASSGIGSEIAVHLARAGASIVVVGRNHERLSETETRVSNEGAPCHQVIADLVNPDDRERVVKEAVEVFGPINILVNSAGVYERSAFDETTVENLDWHWATNFRAPYLLTQTVLPEIPANGSITFISSVAGTSSIRNASAYCATKAALNSLVGVLALELAPRGIRVNAVAPGFTETPMNEKLREDPEVVRIVLEATPLARIGTVEDIAPAVVFLASNSAGYVTGEIFHINGGYPTPFASAPATQGNESPAPGEGE